MPASSTVPVPTQADPNAATPTVPHPVFSQWSEGICPGFPGVHGAGCFQKAARRPPLLPPHPLEPWWGPANRGCRAQRAGSDLAVATPSSLPAYTVRHTSPPLPPTACSPGWWGRCSKEKGPGWVRPLEARPGPVSFIHLFNKCLMGSAPGTMPGGEGTPGVKVRAHTAWEP